MDGADLLCDSITLECTNWRRIRHLCRVTIKFCVKSEKDITFGSIARILLQRILKGDTKRFNQEEIHMRIVMSVLMKTFNLVPSPTHWDLPFYFLSFSLLNASQRIYNEGSWLKVLILELTWSFSPEALYLYNSIRWNYKP